MSSAVAFGRNDRELARVVMWMRRECGVASRPVLSDDDYAYISWIAAVTTKVVNAMEGYLDASERTRLGSLTAPQRLDDETIAECELYLQSCLVEFSRVALRMHEVVNDPDEINGDRVMLALTDERYARTLPILHRVAPSNDNVEAERRGA